MRDDNLTRIAIKIALWEYIDIECLKPICKRTEKAMIESKNILKVEIIVESYGGILPIWAILQTILLGILQTILRNILR